MIAFYVGERRGSARGARATNKLQGGADAVLAVGSLGRRSQGNVLSLGDCDGLVAGYIDVEFVISSFVGLDGRFEFVARRGGYRWFQIPASRTARCRSFRGTSFENACIAKRRNSNLARKNCLYKCYLLIYTKWRTRQARLRSSNALYLDLK